MNPVIEKEFSLAFVRGGLSTKEGKTTPYLQLSNGINAFFVRIDKSVEITNTTFSDLREGDEITVVLRFRVGSTDVTVTGFGE